MQDDLSSAMQDYLKTIYFLTEEKGDFATTSDLAERLDLRPASVTGMLQKLAQGAPPMINYVKHQGVRLTDTGRREALRVVRQHRLMEQFLVEKLGYSWDEVHAEAEQLEHVLLPEMVQRMCEALGNPTHNPHGRRIPSAELNMEWQTAVSLSTLSAGRQAIVRHVQDDDEQILRQLERLGIWPGVRITAVFHSENRKFLIGEASEAISLHADVVGRIFIKTKETIA